MNREIAHVWLNEWTKGDSLLRHARSVAYVMEAYAKKLGENEEEWYCCGLLHDADYEAFPSEHPHKIVKKLAESDEKDLSEAIAAHYTKWNQPYNTTMAKALLACDELTGFIVACAQIRPEGIKTLEVSSVKKKLKQKSFAASVERDEIDAGIEKLGVDKDAHIEFIIQALREKSAELGI